MKNTIQNLFIGLVLFSLVIQLSSGFYILSADSWNVEVNSSLDQYVVIENIHSNVETYTDQTDTGGTQQEGLLDIFWNGAYNVIKGLVDNVALLSLIFGSLSSVLHLPSEIGYALTIIIGLVILFVVIRALTKQSET